LVTPICFVWLVACLFTFRPTDFVPNSTQNDRNNLEILVTYLQQLQNNSLAYILISTMITIEKWGNTYEQNVILAYSLSLFFLFVWYCLNIFYIIGILMIEKSYGDEIKKYKYSKCIVVKTVFFCFRTKDSIT